MCRQFAAFVPAVQLFFANPAHSVANTACEILASMQDLTLNNTFDGNLRGPFDEVIPYNPAGLPGPMTIAVGDGHGADAVLDAPCRRDVDFIHDFHHKDSQWSATKFLTSILVGRIVDDGKLSWDAPMPTYFDWWSPEGARGKVTVKHLLSHTSGFGDHACVLVNNVEPSTMQVLGELTIPQGRYLYMNYSTCAKMIYNEAYGELYNGVSLKDGHWNIVVNSRNCHDGAFCPAGQYFATLGAAKLKEMVLHDGPGKYYWYVEADYEIVGHLIEHVTGLTYEQALNKYINDPLGIAYPAFRPLTSQSGPGWNTYGSAGAWSILMGAYLTRQFRDGSPFISEHSTKTIETPWTFVWNASWVTTGCGTSDTNNVLNKARSCDLYQRENTMLHYGLGLEVYCFAGDCSKPAYSGYGSRGMAPFWERKTSDEGTTNYWGILARQSPPFGSKYWPAPMGQMWSQWALGNSFTTPGLGGMLASKVKAMYDNAHAQGSKASLSTKSCNNVLPCPPPYVPPHSFYSEFPYQKQHTPPTPTPTPPAPIPTPTEGPFSSSAALGMAIAAFFGVAIGTSGTCYIMSGRNQIRNQEAELMAT